MRRRFHPCSARFGAGLGLAALAALVAVLASACSSGSPQQAKSGTVVRVTERDFRITLAPARVRAGDVRVLLRNQGPDAHELILVRASGRSLPLRSDGFTINEARLEPATVATEEPQSPGSVHVLSLHLRPGRYELFCNMAGHYLGGMHAELVVS